MDMLSKQFPMTTFIRLVGARHWMSFFTDSGSLDSLADPEHFQQVKTKDCFFSSLNKSLAGTSLTGIIIQDTMASNPRSTTEVCKWLLYVGIVKLEKW